MVTGVEGETDEAIELVDATLETEMTKVLGSADDVEKTVELELTKSELATADEPAIADELE